MLDGSYWNKVNSLQVVFENTEMESNTNEITETVVSQQSIIITNEGVIFPPGILLLLPFSFSAELLEKRFVELKSQVKSLRLCLVNPFNINVPII